MTVTINGTSGITSPGLNSTGSNTLGDNVADTLNVGNGAIVTDSSGNVGIGTSSPTDKLHVIGNAKLGSAGYISFLNAANDYSSWINNSAGGGNGNLTFYVGGSEKARIDSSGNLLVGTTSEQRPIVSRAPRVTAYATNTEGLNTATSDNTYSGWVHTSLDGGTGTHYIGYFENVVGTVMGTITHNGYNAAYNTSSDYRLKTDVQPMEGALEKVGQLNPVTYNWKSTGDAGQGFIAHELQAVFPDAVTGEKDAVDEEGKPVYQGIDTSFLVATLTKAIQELSAKNDALEARIAALETK